MRISPLKNLLAGAALLALTCVPALAEAPKEEKIPLAELWTQTSAEYRGLCYQAYNTASLQFDNWAPLLTKGVDGKAYLPGSTKPVAIILDLDETVINNSGYQAYLYRTDSTFTTKVRDAWVQFQAQNISAGPPLPGAVDFLKKVEAMGVTPIFISNRAAGYEKETIQVLRNYGINTDNIEDRLLLRKDGDALTQQDREYLKAAGLSEDKSASVAVFQGEGHKEGRRLYIQTSYDVLAYFGDVYGDFEPFVALADSGLKKFQQRNASAEANRDKFGRSWFILPNPMYGYWGVGAAIPEGKVKESLSDYGFEVFLRGRRLIK